MTRPIALKSSTATGSPRRHAAWLILGWLVFWLTSASPACELRVEGTRNGQSAPWVMSAVVPHSSAERSRDPATGGFHCPDVSAVSVAATVAATPQGNDLDASFPLAGLDSLIARRYEWPGELVPGTPPPLQRLPLYLRTARLLI